MKNHTVILSGDSKAFREDFRKVVEECGVKAVFIEDMAGEGASGGGLYIYEAAKKADLKAIAAEGEVRPFLVFTGLALTAGEVEELKRRGLMGIVTRESAPEEVYFTVANALFYDRMIRRNHRAPVSLQVGLSMGPGRMSAVSSLLSRDGMFIVTLHPLPVASVCELSFKLPGARKRMRTKARVLYNISINKDLNIIANPNDPFKRLVTHPGMAVFFMDLPEKDRGVIDEFVRSAIERMV